MDLAQRQRHGILDAYAEYAGHYQKPVAVVMLLSPEGAYVEGHGFTDQADVENLQRYVRSARGKRGIDDKDTRASLDVETKPEEE